MTVGEINGLEVFSRKKHTGSAVFGESDLLASTFTNRAHALGIGYKAASPNVSAWRRCPEGAAGVWIEK
jgi:hypothetical protein